MNRLAAVLTPLLLLCARTGAWARPNIYGFNYPCWGQDCYRTPQAEKNLDALAHTGARWVAVVPTWYMVSASESVMMPTDSSPSDDALRAAIRHAKALGLSVELKPHVDRLDGGSRTELLPPDPAAWFSAYRVMIVHYAEMAAQEHVDLFVVGTELSRLNGSDHRADWNTVISAVRKIYAGRLTYAANWDSFSKVSFWDRLDYVGVDAYFPIPGQESEENMRRGWQARKSALAAAAAGYGKPVMFTEVGIASQPGANAHPWEDDQGATVDLDVQKNYLHAFLETFGNVPWFDGFMLWSWEVDPRASGPQNAHYTVEGKPALDVLKAYFDVWNGQARSTHGVSADDRARLNSAALRARSIIQDLPKPALP